MTVASPPADPPALREVPDLAAPGLRALFVGINPGLASSAAGQHFATPTNPFWRLLHAAGLTPGALRPGDGAALVALGLGITNVCPRPTRAAAELSRQELRAGATALREKVARLRPATVALVGVSLYPVVVPGGREPGPGAKRARLEGARLFVLPNPSGLNASYPGFAAKLVWFQRLERNLSRHAARAPGARA
jgi:TDG/mug DNA glycosylase family protein